PYFYRQRGALSVSLTIFRCQCICRGLLRKHFQAMRERRPDRLHLRFDLHSDRVRYAVTHHYAASGWNLVRRGSMESQNLELIAAESSDSFLVRLDLFLPGQAFCFPGALAPRVKRP